jgi:hypothetical protein
MTLIELIPYLINPVKLNELYLKWDLNIESEALLICMKLKLDLDSEIVFFEIEETEGYLIFEKDEMKYFELFPLEHAIDLIEFDLNLKDKGYSDLEIAKRLFEYRQKDA